MTGKASNEFINRLQMIRPRWVDIQPADQAIPKLRGKLGHSGPPLKENDLLLLHKNSIADLLCYEGIIGRQELTHLCELNENNRSEELDKMIQRNIGAKKLSLISNWDADLVAPLVGMVSESMPVMVIKEEVSNQYVYSPLNEGFGATLRFGSLATDVVDRLNWIKTTLAPLLSEALHIIGGIDLLPIVQEALLMGDELHMRNKSASLMIAAKLIPTITELNVQRKQMAGVVTFLQNNPLFFLNLSMCLSRLYLKTQENRTDKCIVTACASNGVEFGIQISSKPGRWFTNPAPVTYNSTAGQSEEEASPAIGDSPVIEAFGLGGRISLLAPGLWRFLGATRESELFVKKVRMSLAAAELLHDTWLPHTEHNDLPVLIDVNKVVDEQIPILVNTARLSRDGKFLGVGCFEIPHLCFQDAVSI